MVCLNFSRSNVRWSLHAQALRLPLQASYDVVSHPINACKTDSVSHFLRPNTPMKMRSLCLSLPQDVHSQIRFMRKADSEHAMTSTTMSVSTVRTSTTMSVSTLRTSTTMSVSTVRTNTTMSTVHMTIFPS